MRNLETWMREYAADHQNTDNQRLHKICVPVIFTTVVGALHLIPSHVGDVILALALLWYATLGFKAVMLAGVQTAVAVGLTAIVQNAASTMSALIVLVLLFLVAWVGQFFGHQLEGRRPSFFKDLQYLLIGPLWVWLGH